MHRVTLHTGCISLPYLTLHYIAVHSIHLRYVRMKNLGRRLGAEMKHISNHCANNINTKTSEHTNTQTTSSRWFHPKSQQPSSIHRSLPVCIMVRSRHFRIKSLCQHTGQERRAQRLCRSPYTHARHATWRECRDFHSCFGKSLPIGKHPPWSNIWVAQTRQQSKADGICLGRGCWLPSCVLPMLPSWNGRSTNPLSMHLKSYQISSHPPTRKNGVNTCKHHIQQKSLVNHQGDLPWKKQNMYILKPFLEANDLFNHGKNWLVRTTLILLRPFAGTI